MLRRLLLDAGAERTFLEKLDIFQQNPGLLQKDLIRGEVSVVLSVPASLLLILMHLTSFGKQLQKRKKEERRQGQS